MPEYSITIKSLKINSKWLNPDALLVYIINYFLLKNDR